MDQYDIQGGARQTRTIGATEYLGYAAPQTFTGHSPILYHQPSTGGLEGVKEWLEKKSIGNIPNKYLVAGAALAGLAWYARSQRWW